MPFSSSTAARTVATTATASQSLPTNADKYSALADLESVFSSTSISGFSNPVGGMGVNWDSSMRSSTGGVAWGSAAMGAPAGGIPGYAGNTISGYGTSPPPPSYASLAAGGGNVGVLNIQLIIV